MLLYDFEVTFYNLFLIYSTSLAIFKMAYYH